MCVLAPPEAGQRACVPVVCRCDKRGHDGLGNMRF